MVDPQISEICRRAKVSDYLIARGVVLTKTRRGFKCKCPLPDHQDDTPSFNISTMSDGAEVYKCFGCSASGNSITLIHVLEKISKGSVVRRLSNAHGVRVGDYSRIEKYDPLKDDIMSAFCGEDYQAMDIAAAAIAFMDSQGGSEDSVNKVSRVYKEMDRMIEEGDKRGMALLEKALRNIIDQNQDY
jgi:DNA primase